MAMKDRNELQFFLEFLQGLDDKKATTLWCFFDETPDAAGLVIETLAKSHLPLASKLTGVPMSELEPR